MTISILAAALLVQPAQSAPAAAAQAQWTLAASDEEGDHWLDQASVRNEGSVYRFRMRFRPREVASGSMRNILVAYQLDCSRQTLALESLEAFDSTGQIEATRTVPADWLDKDTIYAGSIPAQLYGRICPASARRQLAQRPPPPPIMSVAPPVPVAPLPPMVRIAPPAPPPPPPPPPRGDYPVQRATPVVPLASLFRADDYPLAALRAEEEGVVGYRMAIDKGGRVVGCTVTSSSGSLSLDSTTCRLVQARARFRPARTAKGKKTSDVMYGRIWWQFPEDPLLSPPPPPPAQ